MTVSLLFAWTVLVLLWKTRLQLDQLPQAYIYRVYFVMDRPTFWTALSQGLYGVYLHGSSLINSVVWTMRIELIGSCALYTFYRFCPGSQRVAGLILIFLLNLVIGGHAYLGFSPRRAPCARPGASDRLQPTPLGWLALTLSFAIPSTVCSTCPTPSTTR